MTIPVALTIAGSDSSGGAGIQADTKTFAAFGVYGASVITAVTSQNTTGVCGIHRVPADFVTAQLDAVFGDLDVKAVKIGMVAQRAVIDAIMAGLERWSPGHVVLDPVMVATSGDRLLMLDAIEALRGFVVRPGKPEIRQADRVLDDDERTPEVDLFASDEIAAQWRGYHVGILRGHRQRRGGRRGFHGGSPRFSSVWREYFPAAA